jgi:hypothetical protein
VKHVLNQSRKQLQRPGVLLCKHSWLIRKKFKNADYGLGVEERDG